MKSRFSPLFLTVLSLTACGKLENKSNVQEAWNKDNAPELFGMVSKKFSDLPKEGRLPDDKYPWSGDYWSTRTGGLAHRWQDSNDGTTYKDFQYSWLNKDHFSAGNVTESVDIATLSPAEKYDLLMGRYDFPLAKHERQRQEEAVDPQDKDVPNWFGLCHGWAPATLMEKEPPAVSMMTNADGLQIPFYSGDVKGLISKIYADDAGDARFMGTRCNIDGKKIKRTLGGRIKQDECRDTNPGAFHLVLTEMLGDADPAKRKGFVMDMTASSEVWNQPVTAFKIVKADEKKWNWFTDTNRRHRAPGTVKLVDVIAEVSYIGEIYSSREPQMSARDKYTKTLEIAYTLELDERGFVIGGEWKKNETHPDFIWELTGRPDTSKSYLNLEVVDQIMAKGFENPAN